MKIGFLTAFLGSGSGNQSDAMYQAMFACATMVSERGSKVATGGFGGSGMEAPLRGAHGGIGYTFDDRPVNQYATEVVNCGNSEVPTEVGYGMRLGYLMTADAFVIGCDGGLGTITELAAIANFQQKMWKEQEKAIVLLCPLVASNVKNFLDYCIAQKLIQPGLVKIVETPTEAAKIIIKAMAGGAE